MVTKRIVTKGDTTYTLNIIQTERGFMADWISRVGTGKPVPVMVTDGDGERKYFKTKEEAEIAAVEFIS